MSYLETLVLQMNGKTCLIPLTGFGAQQSGTVVKFNPPSGQDTMVKNGVTQNINTKHQCITAMKEYEAKSLEVCTTLTCLCKYTLILIVVKIHNFQIYNGDIFIICSEHGLLEKPK